MALPEDRSLPEIEAFFNRLQFELITHEQGPPDPTPGDLRRMSAVERRARRLHPRYWVDLKGTDTGRLVRWYGSGDSREAAMRSARARWRIEQGDAPSAPLSDGRESRRDVSEINPESFRAFQLSPAAIS